jgi:hypothetical protein
MAQKCCFLIGTDKHRFRNRALYNAYPESDDEGASAYGLCELGKRYLVIGSVKQEQVLMVMACEIMKGARVRRRKGISEGFTIIFLLGLASRGNMRKLESRPYSL